MSNDSPKTQIISLCHVSWEDLSRTGMSVCSPKLFFVLSWSLSDWVPSKDPRRLSSNQMLLFREIEKSDNTNSLIHHGLLFTCVLLHQPFFWTLEKTFTWITSFSNVSSGSLLTYLKLGYSFSWYAKFLFDSLSWSRPLHSSVWISVIDHSSSRRDDVRLESDSSMWRLTPNCRKKLVYTISFCMIRFVYTQLVDSNWESSRTFPRRTHRVLHLTSAIVFDSSENGNFNWRKKDHCWTSSWSPSRTSFMMHHVRKCLIFPRRDIAEACLLMFW